LDADWSGGSLEVQIELQPTAAGTKFYLAHFVGMAPRTSQTSASGWQFTEGLSESDAAGLTATCYTDQATGESLLIDCGAPPGQNGDSLENLKRLLGRLRLCGGVITHGHFDHISYFGFVPQELLVRMDAHAADFIRRQQEFSLRQASRERVAPPPTREPRPEEIYEPGSAFEVGPFGVQSIPIAHSIPRASMLLIRSPGGKRILHTGDWKFNGMSCYPRFRLERRLREIGQEGVDLMHCDNLNAHLAGFTPEEQNVVRSMAEIMASAHGRVIVALFASNLERIGALAEGAGQLGRPICFSGSGMRFAKELLSRDGLNLLEGGEPVDQTFIFVTGCQAEEGSVLFRELLAELPTGQIWLHEGDTVALSSRAIPGNEGRLKELVNRLLRRGAEVVLHEGEPARLGLLPHERLREAFVHVSGHGQADDIRLALELVRPKCVVPAVRTPPQIEAFRAIAANLGIEVIETPDNHIIV
jgi:ribonuclease J